MARRSTLESIIAKLNNEVGQIETPSYGVGARAAIINIIQRTQELLWQDFDWPFLQIKKDIQLQAGSRYYDIPNEMATDRIQRVQVKYGGYWQDVKFGIEEDRDYPIFDSDIGTRNDPVLRWDYYYDTANDAEQIQVWPIPASNYNGTTLEHAMRITGIKTLSTLVSESDRAELDDRLIVLFAAAEILARDRTDDAASKLEAANQLYRRLKANVSKTESFSLGAMGDDDDDGCRTRLRAVYGGTSGA